MGFCVPSLLVVNLLAGVHLFARQLINAAREGAKQFVRLPHLGDYWLGSILKVEETSLLHIIQEELWRNLFSKKHGLLFNLLRMSKALRLVKSLERLFFQPSYHQFLFMSKIIDCQVHKFISQWWYFDFEPVNPWHQVAAEACTEFILLCKTLQFSWVNIWVLYLQC